MKAGTRWLGRWLSRYLTHRSTGSGINGRVAGGGQYAHQHGHQIPDAIDLIAQCFESVRYPILPLIETVHLQDPDHVDRVREILHVRHYSL
jgi:hypothetical protein